MYLGIDVGGTKTIVASLNNEGVIHESYKFPTPKSYPTFLKQLSENIKNLSVDSFIAAGIGIPGRIDRKTEKGVGFGNLPWQSVAIQHDIKKISRCPVTVENDAKLGGLSEAMLVKYDFKKVLYITIGTGIGIAFIENGVIQTDIGDGGGRTFLIEHNGKLKPWEDFASGRAIVARFGKKASEITDPKIWQVIAHDIALGLIDLIALLQPEVVILGGGVGTHYEKYKNFLTKELETFKSPMLTMPAIKQAERPELAVIYGGYDLAKATYGTASS